MPTLEKVAEVLHRYGDRYECLDAFADDIEELKHGGNVSFQAVSMSPTAVAIETAHGRLDRRVEREAKSRPMPCSARWLEPPSPVRPGPRKVSSVA